MNIKNGTYVYTTSAVIVIKCIIWILSGSVRKGYQTRKEKLRTVQEHFLFEN